MNYIDVKIIKKTTDDGAIARLKEHGSKRGCGFSEAVYLRTAIDLGLSVMLSALPAGKQEVSKLEAECPAIAKLLKDLI